MTGVWSYKPSDDIVSPVRDVGSDEERRARALKRLAAAEERPLLHPQDWLLVRRAHKAQKRIDSCPTLGLLDIEREHSLAMLVAELQGWDFRSTGRTVFALVTVAAAGASIYLGFAGQPPGNVVVLAVALYYLLVLSLLLRRYRNARRCFIKQRLTVFEMIAFLEQHPRMWRCANVDST
jgi:hypothetical protein